MQVRYVETLLQLKASQDAVALTSVVLHRSVGRAIKTQITKGRINRLKRELGSIAANELQLEPGVMCVVAAMLPRIGVGHSWHGHCKCWDVDLGFRVAFHVLRPPRHML